MPLCEYYCEDCHGVFELLRPMREASDPQPCPECDADGQRVVSNFRAFTFRDGYPRKLPDDGTYWHLGEKVSKPISEAVRANEHPELQKKKRPQTAPSRQEYEKYAYDVSEYARRQKQQIDAGWRSPAIETETEQRLGAFNQRMRETAPEARLKARRKPNAEATPRTVSGKHGRTPKKKPKK